MASKNYSPDLMRNIMGSSKVKTTRVQPASVSAMKKDFPARTPSAPFRLGLLVTREQHAWVMSTGKTSRAKGTPLTTKRIIVLSARALLAAIENGEEPVPVAERKTDSRGVKRGPKVYGSGSVHLQPTPSEDIMTALGDLAERMDARGLSSAARAAIDYAMKIKLFG